MDNTKILFVEDNPSVTEEFKIKMINWGYSLTGRLIQWMTHRYGD